MAALISWPGSGGSTIGTQRLPPGSGGSNSTAFAKFETADCFTAQERAVIHLAKEVTVDGRARDTTWEALDFLGKRQRLELVLTIAWYNWVVRIILPLQIDLEPWFVRQ
jgi:alkylhydroperoxidase family enzyme